ncbi:MAG: hypothetical protein JOZ08_14020, partial [Verrucomicrobia bacterium]|nr:hypothetical protein [Verrucomicrobiota bacterium]
MAVARRVKFKVRYSEREKAWVLSIPPKLSKTGKRARLFYKDKDKATQAATRLKERNQKFGVSLANLDPVRLGEASECWKLLDASGKHPSLIAIVREHLARDKQRAQSQSLDACFEQYLESKPLLSDIHRSQIKSVQARLEAAAVNLPV